MHRSYDNEMSNFEIWFDTIFLYLQNEVLQFLAAYLQTQTPGDFCTNQPIIQSPSILIPLTNHVFL